MFKQLFPQRFQRPLGHADHDPLLQILGNYRHQPSQIHSPHQKDAEQQRAHSILDDGIGVSRMLHCLLHGFRQSVNDRRQQIGTGDHRRTRTDRTNQGDNDIPFVPSEVSQKASDRFFRLFRFPSHHTTPSRPVPASRSMSGASGSWSSGWPSALWSISLTHADTSSSFPFCE